MKRKIDPDQRRGLYDKYRVERTDGSHGLGRKHYGCRYFVLDLNHDRFAIQALKAYAWACESFYPQLSSDLQHIALKMEAAPHGQFDRGVVPAPPRKPAKKRART